MSRPLTEAQARLLGLCARYPVFIGIDELRSIRWIEATDVDEIDGLVDAGLLVRAHHVNAVRVTSVGMETAEVEGSPLSFPSDDLKRRIADNLFFGGGQ